MTSVNVAPQRRTLVRARDLSSFREALIELALDGSPLDARRRLVVVPTRASAELLRQAVEARLGGSRPSSAILPDFVTRAELITRLLDGVPGRPPMLQRAEREVLLERVARATADRPRLRGAPYPLRPGLVTAMLDFYDELRRRQRTVRRFVSAIFGELRGERGTDRGTEGLIHQTCFLAFTFLAFERAIVATGAVDEHELRRRLIEVQARLPFDHLVIAVADHPSDPRGLWPADFDLIGRLRGLARVDVVVTDGLHDTGFRERIEAELPGIEERRGYGGPPEPRAKADAGLHQSAVLRTPEKGGPDEICWVSRDREEELRTVVREVRHRAAPHGGCIDEATAIVFHRPLPYLYLSQQVLTEARVPYQAFDALPLASEPYAALLDVVLTFARTGGTRESAIELLRSGQLAIHVDDVAVSGRDAALLDLALTERRALGEADTFVREVDAHRASPDQRRRDDGGAAMRAARAAGLVLEALRPFRSMTRPSSQVRVIASFLRRHEVFPAETDQWRERHLRARAAVHVALESLAQAFERHDDAPRDRGDEDVAAMIRHVVEAETFRPRRGTAGVHLVDAIAARFGEFDHVHIVGLVETDWPERPRRSVFYTAGLLKSLGWPQQPDQTRVQQSVFVDLLGLPAKSLTLHAFQLEGDAIVAPSPLVELARDVVSAQSNPPPARRIFDDEVLAIGGSSSVALEDVPTAWLSLRQRRPDLSLAHYRGFVEDQKPNRPYRVSRVDHYVDCPFRYFAENVLGLPEERDEMAGLTPLERGNLVHHLFERFYREWDQSPGGTITSATLPEAVARFAKLTDESLAKLPEADRALERARLLGSIVASGVAERVFQLEADAGGSIQRRYLESELKGPFTFPLLGGLKSRTVEISGKADRIDVFRDGSLRVVDYKLSRLPDTKTSVQIAVYAFAAQQLLQAREGRSFSIREAMYIAFGDEDRLEGALGSRDQSPAIAVESRAGEFAGVIERIESGQFPPQPRRVSDCSWCRFAGVCRKEYREGVDETAESV